MKNRFITLCLASLIGLLPALAQQIPHWQKQGSATQLMVDNRPYLILGGELGNSSASSPQDIDRIFPKLKRTGLNTVLVPAYWDLIEAEEGTFDFSLIDHTVNQARANGLRIVFLWFGAWKNSMSCYAPLWFKQDYKKYPRVRTETGKPLEIASPFSEEVLEADSRAFSRLMAHLRETDSEEHTVIMVQVENEIGMLEDARDHSSEAERLFRRDIPRELGEYLASNAGSLHPRLAALWKQAGGRTSGSWTEVFGEGLYTDAQFAKSLGFSGKASISPRHVEGINEVFSPTQAEIDYAHEVMETIRIAKEQGKGVVSLRGKMIDAPIVERARQVIEMEKAMFGGAEDDE